MNDINHFSEEKPHINKIESQNLAHNSLAYNSQILSNSSTIKTLQEQIENILIQLDTSQTKSLEKHDLLD